ncbi:MAG: hypothetical protein WCE68_01775 [Anaerolineales bacterium]
MKLKKWRKSDPRSAQRLCLIVELGRRRDRLLEAPELDLDGLARLLADYEAADLPSAAADLRRRLEWYRSKQSPFPEKSGIIDH